VDYVNKEIFDKPAEFYTLDKLRRAVAVDRRLSLREIIEKSSGMIPRFKSKDELLEEEFAKFVSDCKPEDVKDLPALKNFFKPTSSTGWCATSSSRRNSPPSTPHPPLRRRISRRFR